MIRIFAILFLLSSICLADEPSIVDCGFDLTCLNDQGQELPAIIPYSYDYPYLKNLSINIPNSPVLGWITIRGKNELITISCMDKNFDGESCADIKIVRHGLVMGK